MASSSRSVPARAVTTPGPENHRTTQHGGSVVDAWRMCVPKRWLRLRELTAPTGGRSGGRLEAAAPTDRCPKTTRLHVAPATRPRTPNTRVTHVASACISHPGSEHARMTNLQALVRLSGPAGEPRYRLGHPLVDSYLESWPGVSDPTPCGLSAHDLKTFFTRGGQGPSRRRSGRLGRGSLNDPAALSTAQNQGGQSTVPKQRDGD